MSPKLYPCPVLLNRVNFWLEMARAAEAQGATACAENRLAIAMEAEAELEADLEAQRARLAKAQPWWFRQ